MSVLHDLLAVVKPKPPQYMVLDPVQADPPEPKAYIQFLSLKKVNSAWNIKRGVSAIMCVYPRAMLCMSSMILWSLFNIRYFYFTAY